MSLMYSMFYLFDKRKKNIIISALLLFSPVITLADKGYDLDEFDDLELQSLDKQKNRTTNSAENKKVILFEDNLYLLNDDFDFGEDEVELQKLELNPDDMETAKEYEYFLNAFFENSIPVGYNSSEQFNAPTQKTSKKHKAKSNSGSKSPKKTLKGSSQPTQSFRPPRGAMGIGISIIGGATVPVTMAGFTAGSNFGIRIDTPISFNLAGMEANLGIDILASSMTAVDGGDNLKLKNIIANISIFPLSKIEFRTGLGLTPESIGDYSVTALSIPVDVNYSLPMSFSGFKFALNLHAQRALGFPPIAGALEGDATDFLYIGLLINTPLAF